jgi:cellobiose-specific phosphotransferase system component IIA
MAGEDDPVGAYGKGVKQVFRELKETRHKNVTLNLYPGDRHEIHNELDKDKVVDDLISWLDSVVGEGKEVEVDKAVNDAVEEFNSKLDETIQKSKESINEAIESTNEVVEQIVQDAAEQAKVDAENISVEDKLIEETVEPQTVEEIVAAEEAVEEAEKAEE